MYEKYYNVISPEVSENAPENDIVLTWKGDFYVGMFKKHDILVAQDRLYKERVSHSRVTAKYGRIFKCPLTYIRIVDRLGIDRGPSVEILRGGLRKKYVVLRLVSVYNYPISVNVYVGCENKMARALTVTAEVDTKTDKGDNITASTISTVTSTDASKEVKTVSDNSTTVKPDRKDKIQVDTRRQEQYKWK